MSAALSHEVMHNVLGYIPEDYLNLKKKGEKLTDQNSLGLQTYKTFLRLGFWKKLVYLTELDVSLDLCHKFIEKEQAAAVIEAAGENINDFGREMFWLEARHFVLANLRLNRVSQVISTGMNV